MGPCWAPVCRQQLPKWLVARLLRFDCLIQLHDGPQLCTAATSSAVGDMHGGTWQGVLVGVGVDPHGHVPCCGLLCSLLGCNSPQ
jgi:hypothetical protein